MEVLRALLVGHVQGTGGGGSGWCVWVAESVGGGRVCVVGGVGRVAGEKRLERVELREGRGLSQCALPGGVGLGREAGAAKGATAWTSGERMKNRASGEVAAWRKRGVMVRNGDRLVLWGGEWELAGVEGSVGELGWGCHGREKVVRGGDGGIGSKQCGRLSAVPGKGGEGMMEERRRKGVMEGWGVRTVNRGEGGATRGTCGSEGLVGSVGLDDWCGGLGGRGQRGERGVSASWGDGVWGRGGGRSSMDGRMGRRAGGGMRNGVEFR
ncbi:hypothetical protein Tco_1318617 [Tanacetum coccineum]|uniref:Uncharacterized protein n=1 Tax=Tanacetum coccineum TaxID=301880 RepID=A0ABQ5HD07_9ASTR